MKLPDHPDSDEDYPFGPNEEEAIASLFIEHPSFFYNIVGKLTPDRFKKPEVAYVVAHILDYYDKYNEFPTKGLLEDRIAKHLTVDDQYEDIMEIVHRESDPREVPAIKDRLIDWAKSMSFSMLYDEQTIQHYKQGNFEQLIEIFEEAQSIQEIHDDGLWFFENLEKVFEEDNRERFTTGFSQLDRYLNEGGPSRKEVLVWMAPTGVGKSLMLVNNAINNVVQGRNVLYLTLELSDVKSALRALGVLSNKPLHSISNEGMKKQVLKSVEAVRQSDAGDLVFFQYPSDEISVDHIYALLENLKRSKNWRPDLIIVDYLELMVGRRNSENNNGDYTKQKAIANQLRGLAINEDVVIYTATQTNRSGNEEGIIDVTKMAESYGKSMSMDYLVSINQTEEEYEQEPAPARLYIAKNRNGPKFQTVPVQINYKTMKVKENTR